MSHTKFFKDLSKHDVAIAGGKGESLFANAADGLRGWCAGRGVHGGLAAGDRATARGRSGRVSAPGATAGGLLSGQRAGGRVQASVGPV